jgi:putative Mn2+ efflux pump MntP
VVTIILFGFLSGLDNLQVMPAIGLIRLRASQRLLIALVSGVSEGVMPLVGLLVGRLFQRVLAPFAAIGGPIMLLLCGMLIVYLALKEKEPSTLAGSRWVLVGLPISLSLDNLFAGVALGSMGYPVVLSALTIGVISGAMSLFGLFMGKTVRRWLPEKVELAAGAYLMALAVFKLLR